MKFCFERPHLNTFIASFLAAFLIVGWVPAVFAYDVDQKKTVMAEQTPKEYEGVGISEKLGDSISLDIPVVDQNGNKTNLSSFFEGDTPVLFTIVYYACPSLCNLHLNGLLDVFKQMKLTAGKDFKVVGLSMDHREGSEEASAKLDAYLESYARPDGNSGWHFLTASEENIKKIADAVGFGYRWDEGQEQYAHASAAMITTPGGKLSRYLNGIQFDPGTVRLSLLEASEGKIGTIVDKFFLYCFQFDASKGKYTVYAINIMRIGAVLIVLVLAIFLIPAWRRGNGKGNLAV